MKNLTTREETKTIQGREPLSKNNAFQYEVGNPFLRTMHSSMKYVTDGNIYVQPYSNRYVGKKHLKWEKV